MIRTSNKSVEEILKELTNEQKMLLYMIGLYSEVKSIFGKQWLKDLALKGLLSKGIRDQIYDWDYAPASIMYRGSRKVINISQEGTNDLNDLRSKGIVARLRLGTSRHFYFNAYNLTEEGVEVLKALPQEFRDPIDELVHCKKCGKLYEVIPIDEEAIDELDDFEEVYTSEERIPEEYKEKKDGIFMICKTCKVKINTRLDWIEAVSYKCVPKWLKINVETVWKPISDRERKK